MKNDGMTILARTDNKLAYKMFGMLVEFIVKFVNRRVALTMIFSSYWILRISIKMYESFFYLTANAYISPFWHNPSTVSIQPIIIGGFKSVVYNSIIIVDVTCYLCMTIRLYLCEHKLANTSIAIFNNFNFV